MAILDCASWEKSEGTRNSVLLRDELFDIQRRRLPVLDNECLDVSVDRGRMKTLCIEVINGIEQR